MRCLRCALDYSPDVQYCDRCGRTLSRPPGSGADYDADFSPAQDLSSLYSTFAPPRGEREVAVSTLRSRDYVVDQDGAGVATLTPEGAPAVPIDAAHGEEPRAFWSPDPSVATPEIAPREGDARAQGVEDSPSWREVETAQPLRHALPGEVSIEPPVAAGQADAAEEGDLFGDGAGPFAGLRGKPLTIGGDVEERQAPRIGTVRLPRRRTGGQAARARLPLAARLAIPLVVIALALGALANARHATYSTDLQAARQLASAQHYAAALARYRQAIRDWPLNGAAIQEQARVAATATAVVAQAAAAAQQQQARAAADAQRAGVYAAWQRMRRQNAEQAQAHIGSP